MTKQRGGRREGAGRPKGRLDKATIEQKATLEELARTHTETALNVLVNIAKNPDCNASARVAAATSILDRGYGRPRQAVAHSNENGDPLIPTFILQFDDNPEHYKEPDE